MKCSLKFLEITHAIYPPTFVLSIKDELEKDILALVYQKSAHKQCRGMSQKTTQIPWTLGPLSECMVRVRSIQGTRLHRTLWLSAFC